MPATNTAAQTATNPERIKTYKVETTSTGIILWINGKPFCTESGESMAFDINRCAGGLNPPAVERQG